jgi:transcriptional/translational regulatory protein YebC/TACO1
VYGPNPDDNAQLAAVLATARKAGVPKTIIDAAIARGQGRTTKGATLESITYEAIIPPTIALIVEVETEVKSRALQDLGVAIKKAKGTATGSKYLFSRVGRVVFEKSTTGIGVDQVLEEAIEAGAEDVETDEAGNIVVWTSPTQTMQVCKSLGGSFGLNVLSSDIMWSPNEDTRAPLNSSAELISFAELLARLKEDPDVQAVYSNVTRGETTDEEWAAIEENLDT